MGSHLTSAWQGSHTYTVTETYANVVGSPAAFRREVARVGVESLAYQGGGGGVAAISGSLTSTEIVVNV